jgi:VWFA-related protein
MRHESVPQRLVKSIPLAAALLLIAISVGWLMADDVIDKPVATFFEPLRVPLVSVDVVVTDKAGKPILGLTQDDFEVREDGAPMSITHFFAAATARDPEPIADPESPERADRRQYLPESFSQDVYLALYFDDSNIDVKRRRSALKHLRDFLEQPLPSNMKTMLVRYDGSMHVEVGFSNRPDELIPAVNRIMDEAPVTIANSGEALLRRMQAVATAAPHFLTPSPMALASSTGRQKYEGVDMRVMDNSAFLPEIRAYAEDQYVRNRASLEALDTFVNHMVGIHGRKVVLWVGDLEMQAGVNLFRTWQELFQQRSNMPTARKTGNRGQRQTVNPMIETMQYDLTREINELVDRANNNRVSFYTLSSLTTSVGIDVTSNQRILETSGSPGQQSTQDTRSQEDALKVMSDLTGGVMLRDNRKLDKQLHQISNELETYYSLAYSPPSPGDGEKHNIRVNVNREGAHLRYRLSYRDTGKEESTADRTLVAGMFGVADNPLGISVECQEQEPRGEDTFLVPVVVRVPLGKLVLVPEEDYHQAQISVFSVVVDEAGRASDIHERAYPIKIKNDQISTAVEQKAKFTLGMVLRKGSQRIAVSVRDDRSSSEATAFTEVSVGTGDKGTVG